MDGRVQCFDPIDHIWTILFFKRTLSDGTPSDLHASSPCYSAKSYIDELNSDASEKPRKGDEDKFKQLTKQAQRCGLFHAPATPLSLSAWLLRWDDHIDWYWSTLLC